MKTATPLTKYNMEMEMSVMKHHDTLESADEPVLLCFPVLFCFSFVV